MATIVGTASKCQTITNFCEAFSGDFRGTGQQPVRVSPALTSTRNLPLQTSIAWLAAPTCPGDPITEGNQAFQNRAFCTDWEWDSPFPTSVASIDAISINITLTWSSESAITSSLTRISNIFDDGVNLVGPLSPIGQIALTGQTGTPGGGDDTPIVNTDFTLSGSIVNFPAFAQKRWLNTWVVQQGSEWLLSKFSNEDFQIEVTTEFLVNSSDGATILLEAGKTTYLEITEVEMTVTYTPTGEDPPPIEEPGPPGVSTHIIRLR